MSTRSNRVASLITTSTTHAMAKLPVTPLVNRILMTAQTVISHYGLRTEVSLPTCRSLRFPKHTLRLTYVGITARCRESWRWSDLFKSRIHSGINPARIASHLMQVPARKGLSMADQNSKEKNGENRIRISQNFGSHNTGVLHRGREPWAFSVPKGKEWALLCLNSQPCIPNSSSKSHCALTTPSLLHHVPPRSNC